MNFYCIFCTVSSNRVEWTMEVYLYRTVLTFALSSSFFFLLNQCLYCCKYNNKIFLLTYIQNIICPNLHFSYTSFLLEIICLIWHLSQSEEDIHCPTHHLSNKSFVLPFICSTLHFSYTSFGLHFHLAYTMICPTNRCE